mmetsp:Transcript_30541/g.81013  ORF Transcript_30541/g.81013 Transcript_30541/m.81013 type:complete len:216 (-) Transcript_30541:236-883(-)
MPRAGEERAGPPGARPRAHEPEDLAGRAGWRARRPRAPGHGVRAPAAGREPGARGALRAAPGRAGGGEGAAGAAPGGARPAPGGGAGDPRAPLLHSGAGGPAPPHAGAHAARRAGAAARRAGAAARRAGASAGRGRPAPVVPEVPRGQQGEHRASEDQPGAGEAALGARGPAASGAQHGQHLLPRGVPAPGQGERGRLHGLREHPAEKGADEAAV